MMSTVFSSNLRHWYTACAGRSLGKLRFCNCSGHLNFKGNGSHWSGMKEQTRCSTIDIAGRIEVLHARYFEHAFAPHWHDEFAIGLIDAGVEQFECGSDSPRDAGR